MATGTTLRPVTALVNKHDQQKALEDWIAHALGAKFEAEGTALHVKDLYHEKDFVKCRDFYTAAASAYNKALESLILPLGGHGEAPSDPTVKDVDALQAGYAKFMAEAVRLIDLEKPLAGHPPDEFAASFIPSISDIAKLIDSIFGIFKFFMQRKKEERDFLIGRLDNVKWNQWPDVGKATATPAGPSGQTPPAKPK